MHIDLQQARLELGRNQILHLTDARRARLTCDAGTAWITVDGQLRDVVLEAGEQFEVGSNALVLVHALGGDATLRLQAAP